MDHEEKMDSVDAGDNFHDEEMKSDDSDDSVSTDEEDNENENEDQNGDVYLPGKPLEEGEELVCDESAYIMLHQAKTGAPCLSFDIIPDNLGSNRQSFPMTGYIVAGTQAAKTHVNNIIVMKMSNLHRTSQEDDDEEVESDDEDENESAKRNKPNMDCALMKHPGCINRIRAAKVSNNVLAATWSELGRVNIWNLNEQLLALDDRELLSSYNKEGKANKATCLFTFSGHQQEGYGIDWSPLVQGRLATGDCRRDIHVWEPQEGGTWNVDQRPLTGHIDSVEDLQWSPNEQSVLASCSVDKSIRIWDIRAQPTKACMLACENAHESDINVISWNKNEPLIVSGGDDAVINVWDLRQFQNKTPVATFKHHTKPVTTIEWHPTDSSVFASGGADDQIALWDLAVEKDTEVEASHVEETLPPQLLFIHQGQNDIKELHWHPQLSGVIMSTAHSGFNVFKTISV